MFPCREKDEWVGDKLLEAKTPRTLNGHLDGSTDPEQIKRWWSIPGWEDSVPGIAAGKSGVIILDIDNKDGRDGYHSLTEAGLDIPESLEYQTKNGGTHVILKAPPGFSYNGTRDHKTPDGTILTGIDRRSGSSYAVYWGEDVPWELKLAESPDWLLTPTNMTLGSGFNGTAAEWLDTIGDDQPDDRVLDAIQRTPDNLLRDMMLTRQTEFVLLAGEGHPGVRHGLDALKEIWLSRKHVSGDPVREFDIALVGAIRKYGDLEPEPPKDLAKTVLSKTPDHPLLWGVKDASQRRELETALIERSLGDEEILAVVWHNALPAVKPVTVKALRTEITDVRNGDHPGEAEEKQIIPSGLLSENELQRVENLYTFVDRYLFTTSQDNRINPPYHRMNAWQLLAILFSDRFYIQINRGLNLNLFGFVIGDSGTGKTESHYDMTELLSAAGILDEVDIGHDATEVGLHKTLLKRDMLVSWFNSDEADQLLVRMLPTKNGQVFGALQQKLTEWYDRGRVSMLHRSDQTESGKISRTYLTMWLGGTEEAILTNLMVSQVKKGFVARFITVFGEPKIVTKDAMKTKVWGVDQRKNERNPHVWALGEEMREIRDMTSGRNRQGIIPTANAVARMDEARWSAYSMFQGDPLWELIEPNVTRITDILWKAAGLTALSNGRTVIEVEDVLVALRAGEEWLAASVRLMRGIRSSEFGMTVEKVFAYISSRESITGSALYRWMFRTLALSQRDGDEMTANLKAQGRIKWDEKKGAWSVVE